MTRVEEETPMKRITKKGAEGHRDVIDTVSRISLDNIP